jgi:capsular exopolysaccharide synthesis family protein
MANLHHDDMADELDLRDYVAIIRRRIPLIAGVTLCVVALALIYSLLQTKTYTTTAEVRVFTSELIAAERDSGFRDIERIMGQEIRFVGSDEVRAEVRSRAGGTGTVTTRTVSTNDVLHITASAATPELAASLANETANVYLEFRRASLTAQNEASAQQSEANAARLAAELEDLDSNDPVYQAKAGQRTTELATAERFRSLAEQSRNGVANILSVADLPGSPASPKPTRNALMGGILGLLAGLGLAFLVDYFDDAMRGGEDLERVSRGAPMLAAIPRLAETDTQSIVSLTKPDSRVVEAFRALRTSVLFLGVDREMTVIQVTSPLQGDGKSTTITNLAVLLAKAGKRVIVMDMDLRRPRMQNLFGIDTEVGFTSVLTGESSLRDALVPVPDAGTLWVLPSGPKPPNPSELLGSAQVAKVVERLRPQVDILLLDSAPVLPVTDSRLVASLADGVILVVDSEASRRAVKTAADILNQGGRSRLIGTVVNRVDAGGVVGNYGAAAGYGYGYGYGYDESTKGSQSRGIKGFLRRLRRKKPGVPPAPPMQDDGFLDEVSNDVRPSVRLAPTDESGEAVS